MTITRHSEKTVEAVCRLWAEGLLAKDIGERLGITKFAVIGIANRRRDRCHERINFRNSDETIAAVCAMRAAGRKSPEIAKALSITTAQAWGIYSRHRLKVEPAQPPAVNPSPRDYPAPVVRQTCDGPVSLPRLRFLDGEARA